MFNYLFKTGTYYLLFKKFKKEIIAIVVSLCLLIIIFGIFNDVFIIFQITDVKTLAIVVFLKWFLVVGIIVFNIFTFKRLIKKNNSSKSHKLVKKQHDTNNTSIDKSTYSQQILNKEKLLTKSDLVLKKYLDKNS